MALGSHFRPLGMGRTGLDGWPRLPDGRTPAERGHALGIGDRRGVHGSFKDFLQNQSAFAVGPNWPGDGNRGHISGNPDRGFPTALGKGGNKPSQTSMLLRLHGKGRRYPTTRGLCVLNTPKATGKPGLGKSHGMSRAARAEGPGEREQDRILGRGKVTPWGRLPSIRPQKGKEPEEVRGPQNGIGNHGALEVARSGHGLPAEVQLEVKKGSFAKALEVARSRDLLGQAWKELNKGFWTSNTAAVKRSRREEVMKLASLVAGNRDVLPLSRQTVEYVAAALKAGGLASADQYLNELKLLHVEAGYSLEAWLARTFQLCKKSVVRERGPIRRAPEVDLDSLPAGVWDNDIAAAVPLCAWAYAWGVAWMLREVELSKVKWEHVTWNRATKTVRLYIPHSKMDQKGLGVARTLQCCGESPCWRGCAWAIIQGLLERRGRRAGHPDEFMFTNSVGAKPTKSEMVSSWRAMTDGDIAGHSARRTGAMAYVRRGMGIRELAFLGRWRSAVVLTYAEEALESTPANRPGVTTAVDGITAPGTPCPGTPARLIMTPVVETRPRRDGHAAGHLEVTRPKAKSLWVKSTERGGSNPLHFISNADWSLPMKDWTTACGWSFAKRSAHISFVTDPSLNVLKCKKCLGLKGLRDEVKGGCSPAQLVAADLGHLASTDRPGDMDVSQNRPFRKRRVEGGQGSSVRKAVLKV